MKAEIFKGLLPIVLLQSAPNICHKVNGNKKLAVSPAANGCTQYGITKLSMMPR
jgi:hypothetical protein